MINSEKVTRYINIYMNDDRYNKRQIYKGGPNFNMLDFKNITKPEICYMMGFLWADGHLKIDKFVDGSPYYTAINFNILDDDFAEVSSTFNTHMRWTTYKRKQSLNNKIIACSFIYDTRLAQLFKKYDFHNKSTSSPSKLLNAIPAKYHYLFWRGYFDGDGCLSIKGKGKQAQLNISSTFEQKWTSVCDLLDELQIKYKINHWIRKNSKYSCVEIYTMSDIIKFCSYIYSNRDNDKMGLTRKYQKYLTVQQIFNNRRIKSSKYTGITKSKHNKWEVRIWSKTTKKYIFVGSFNTELEAYIERKKLLV